MSQYPWFSFWICCRQGLRVFACDVDYVALIGGYDVVGQALIYSLQLWLAWKVERVSKNHWHSLNRTSHQSHMMASGMVEVEDDHEGVKSNKKATTMSTETQYYCSGSVTMGSDVEGMRTLWPGGSTWRPCWPTAGWASEEVFGLAVWGLRRDARRVWRGGAGWGTAGSRMKPSHILNHALSWRLIGARLTLYTKRSLKGTTR